MRGKNRERSGSAKEWRAAMGTEDERQSESASANARHTRPSLKSLSQLNCWKQKLRENCFKRVREDRTRLLWRLRMLSHTHPAVRSTFHHIVSDEFRKIKDNSADSNMPHHHHDLLWDYDADADAVHSCYDGECEDILLEMQRIFYDDLNSHPPIQGLESTIDTWEDDVDEYLASAVFEHMQLNEDKDQRDEIWCPICKQGELKEDHSHIYCTRCELQLNKANELNLDFLRDRLAEAHTEHLDRGCRLKPRFCIKTKFSLTALYISCEGCGTFEVVI